ncbi:MAG: hypothetical protein ACRDNT_01045 [Streptosporangiaceae bacterium]
MPEPHEITGNEPDVPDHYLGDPGTCRCDAEHDTSRSPGWVYTLHLDPPIEPYPGAPARLTAGHYTGLAPDAHPEPMSSVRPNEVPRAVRIREAKHAAGQGARLTQVQLERGGSWRIADYRPGDRNVERQMKQHGAARRCPICKAEAQAQASPQAAPVAVPEPRTAPEAQTWPQAGPVADAELELEAELEI